MSSAKDLDIVITNQNARTYRNCNSFDATLVQSGEFWHMIIVRNSVRI